MKRAHPLRSFRRDLQRQAGKLPNLKRSGGWALASSTEKPRLHEGPLFGSTLEELTGAEAKPAKAAQKPARRVGRAEEPPTSSASSPGGTSRRRVFRREEPREPAPPRALPAEAPAAEIARWAGEKPQASQQPVRRKRESPAGERPVPDRQAVADHRREVAARSRRPLSVEGMPKELSVREESPEARGRSTRAASSEAFVPQERQARLEFEASPERSLAAPAAEPRERAPRDPLSSLPRQGGRRNDPWGTLVSGAQAPRTLLDVPTKENLPKASPKRNAAPRTHPLTQPLAPGDSTSSDPKAANVSPISRDRSSASTFDSHEGRPAPFSPIAADPLSSYPTASPLGPFPNASATEREGAETLEGVPSFSSLEAFPFAPSSSPDDLSDLAAKIDRILVDEARRHGIDV